MASFPTSAKVFASFSNGATSDAAQVTDIYAEVEAIEDGYLNGSARLNSSNSTVKTLSVTGGSTFGGNLNIGGNAIVCSSAATIGSTAAPVKEISCSTLYVNGGRVTAGGGKPTLIFLPQSNEPPSTLFATPDTRNGHPVLDFDGNADEEAVFSGWLSSNYGGNGLTCDIINAFSTATTGSIYWLAAIERINTSGLDIDADSFAGFQGSSNTAPGTCGQVIKTSIVFTDGAQMDSLAAGEAFRLKIRRDADGSVGVDDITSDAEVRMVILRET